MPSDTPYAKRPAIVVRFNDSDRVTDRGAWAAKITALLDEIEGMRLGAELMYDIQQSGRTVYVQPALAQGNQCGAGSHNCYVRLRQALENFGFDFATELRTAFERAKRAQISLDGIARRLASGMSAVTVETSRNVARQSGSGAGYEKRKLDRKGKPVYSSPGVPVMVDAKMTFDSMRDLLLGLCDGSRKKDELQMRRGNRMLSDDLIRCFYIPNPTPGTEFLVRGLGSDATISFKPDVVESCWLNEHVKRPPAIGLAHELIHAWRNVHGLRYFKDKEKVADAATPDDEVMTTGFPPYQWEKYSENMFRTLWADHREGAIIDPGTPMHGAQPLRHKY
jgi:Effector protein